MVGSGKPKSAVSRVNYMVQDDSSSLYDSAAKPPPLSKALTMPFASARGSVAQPNDIQALSVRVTHLLYELSVRPLNIVPSRRFVVLLRIYAVHRLDA